jgi:hypothetical protein
MEVPLKHIIICFVCRVAYISIISVEVGPYISQTTLRHIPEDRKSKKKKKK